MLIADDDRDACASLEALLHDEGHSTCCVFNGADVLLDIGMPGMTGYDVAKVLGSARIGQSEKLPATLVRTLGPVVNNLRRRTSWPLPTSSES